jgi:hypothetical protein
MLNAFWGEMAPCEHFVQIYEHDDVFLDALQGFIEGGLRAGDGCIVIATVSHLQGLEQRLAANGVDVEAERARGGYMPVAAAAALERFMVRGWPDEKLFRAMVGELLSTARGSGRRVRAFGEMVALMWAQGHKEAVMKLENMWHTLCRDEAFSLFCAYPRAGFTAEMADGMREVCEVHSRVLPPGSN